MLEYPKIKSLAKREEAKIYFADEAGMNSDYHSGKICSARNTGSKEVREELWIKYDFCSFIKEKDKLYDSGEFG